MSTPDTANRIHLLGSGVALCHSSGDMSLLLPGDTRCSLRRKLEIGQNTQVHGCRGDGKALICWVRPTFLLVEVYKQKSFGEMETTPLARWHGGERKAGLYRREGPSSKAHRSPAQGTDGNVLQQASLSQIFLQVEGHRTLF